MSYLKGKALRDEADRVLRINLIAKLESKKDSNEDRTEAILDGMVQLVTDQTQEAANAIKSMNLHMEKLVKQNEALMDEVSKLKSVEL